MIKTDQKYFQVQYLYIHTSLWSRAGSKSGAFLLILFNFYSVRSDMSFLTRCRQRPIPANTPLENG